MLGRVMSLAMLAGIGVAPISMAVAGVLIDLDATELFVSAGVLVVLATIGAYRLGLAELFDTPRPPATAHG